MEALIIYHTHPQHNIIIFLSIYVIYPLSYLHIFSNFYLSHIIRLMSEPDHFSLYRKLHAAAKNDDDLFRIIYTLAEDSRPIPASEDEGEKNEKQIRKEHAARMIGRSDQQHKNAPAKAKHRQGSVEIKESIKVSKPKHKYMEKKEHKEETKAQQAEKSQDNTPGLDESIEQLQKGQIRKSEQNYELMEKLADSDSDILQGLQEPHLINKRSKSSQFKDVFQEMQLARASQLSIKDPRKLYDDYRTISQIELSRSNGEKLYFRGTVQFSDTVKWYCNIISPQVEGALVVQGRNTNRAMHEDEVYFTIISEQKQKILCKVVAIIARRVHEVVGKIQFHKAKQLYLLKPTNAKFASMNIDLTQIDKEWLHHACSKYFLAEFSYWDPTDDHPYCKIKGEYGTFGEVEIETQALLKTYSIEQPQYTQEDIQAFIGPFKANINAAGEYVVPVEQAKRRKDFRKWRTFLVRGCDADAAFSVYPLVVRGKTDPNFLKKNIFQINVHFTDVGYFVREGTAVDSEAKKRIAGYNLVHRVLSLLPQPFSSTFCALRQNRDALTLSISFQIDEQGNILETSKVTRSIICPPFAFSHEQLQRMIAGNVPAEEWRAWNCGCRMESQYKGIASDIALINQLISKRRQRRIQAGALIFETPVKSFKFDENLKPTSFQLKTKNEAHYMIQECVITASTKAAEFLLKNLKGKAILYRHRFPGFKRLTKFKQYLKKAGQSLPENSKDIQKYINQIVTSGQLKQSHRDVIKYQTIKLLQNFDYFQALGSEPTTWVHYAINIPLYTHCSTPTRHYGDLLVQRQLATAIDGRSFTTPDAELTSLLQVCTKGKLIAQHIQNGCEKIFLCMYLRQNPVFTSAVLTDIEEWGLKICIPRFNFKTMLKFKNLKGIKAGKVGTDQNSRKFVRLDFTSENGDLKTKFVLKEMQEISLQIRSGDTYPLDYGFSIVLPHPTDPTQKILIS